MMPAYWYTLIADHSVSLSDKEIIDVAFKALELLMPKVQSLPATPNDSKSNADQALAELKAAEDYGINRTGSPDPQSGSNGTDVAIGQTES